MKEDMRRYNLWLAFTAGLRPMRHNELIEEYGSAYDVFLAAARGDIPSKTAADGRMLALMKAKAEEGYIDRCLEYLHNQNISVVLFKDKNYPALLREIHSAPAALFVKGRLPDKIRLPIAVIGSRRCSDYGRKAAEMISGQLAECGACIVSGMAYGIDKVAAIAALERSKAEISTIAVLGSGVDVVYPEENRKLYDEICDKGAVVSEFLPGTVPDSKHFPQRNRGCDRVMWLSICLSKDVCIGVGIASPCTKYMVSQIDQTFLVFAANTQYGQRPFYDAGFHILVSRDLNVFLDRCFCHCKLVIAALIVVMA